mmetsp:Transcript_4269/g.13531  ORF Transcript_4269/g.13531 Transcript_4269/m.13531 type:complete len:389 (+) Transcript_4269:59-1225(+)
MSQTLAPDAAVLAPATSDAAAAAVSPADAAGQDGQAPAQPVSPDAPDMRETTLSASEAQPAPAIPLAASAGAPPAVTPSLVANLIGAQVATQLLPNLETALFGTSTTQVASEKGAAGSSGSVDQSLAHATATSLNIPPNDSNSVEQANTLEALAKNDEELATARQVQSQVGAEARADQVLRFLRANKGKVSDTVEMLKEHLEYRKTIPPLKSSVRDELLKGKYCFFGRDKEGDQVVVARLRLMGKHTYENLEVVRESLVHFAEFMESKLSPMGQITVVFSRLESSRNNTDLEWLKVATSVLQKHYPERLKKAFVAPIGLLYRSVWAVAQYYFDPDTRKKLQISTDPNCFFEGVDHAELPEEIGGHNKNALHAEDIIAYAERVHGKEGA